MKVLSFGEIIWDIFGKEKHIGGAPLNFAAHCALLGSKVWLASSAGDDELGEEAILQVKDFGINTDFISKMQGKETGKCIVCLDENAVPSYNILDDVAYDYIQMPEIKDEIDVIAFGTLALRRENNRKILSQILKTHTFSEVFADVNIRAPFYSKEAIEMCLENATIVKISDEELPVVSEVIFGETFSLEDAAQKIADKYAGIKAIIITKGANGSCCYDCRTGKFFFADAREVNVVSTVGAGDSFSAAFLIKYMEKRPYIECLEFASKISAFVCSNVEAVPKNMQEINRNIQKKVIKPLAKQSRV